MVTSTLVILRHGQTDYNAKRQMTGQRDIPLNTAGEEQARQAGALLRDMRFDKVYSSSLGRAFNTAALALKSAGIDLPIEKRIEIIEMDNGDFTGRCVDEPEVARRIGTSDDVPWPGGESVQDVVARVQKFYDAEVMPRLRRGENVMVVAHNVVLKAFEIVLGVETFGTKRKIPNAVPAVCDYEDGALKSFRYLSPASETSPANQPTRPATQRKDGHGPKI